MKKNMVIVVLIISGILAIFLGMTNQTHTDGVEIVSSGPSWEIFLNKDGEKESLFLTDALKITYEIADIKGNEGKEVFFLEGWDDGTYLSVFSIEAESFLIKNFGPIDLRYEIPQDDTVQLLLFQSVGDFSDVLPFYVAARPFSLQSGELISTQMECGSDIYTQQVKRVSELMQTDQFESYSTRSKQFIMEEYTLLVEQCS